MFLRIPDSVMWMKAFMRLEVSVEVSIWLNRCFRRFKLSLEYSDWLLSSQSSYSSFLQACEVDVFEHPRFCDEFSHLVNRVLMRLPISVEVSPWLNRCFRRFKCPLSFQIYCVVVNDSSLQLIIASEVYVFEHPRFCDQFSHIVDRGFDATATLCWSLTLIE